MKDFLRSAWMVVRDAGASSMKNASSDVAAGVTFYSIFSLFPMALVLAGLFGLFADEDQVREDVVDFLVGLLPVGRELVASQLEKVVSTRHTVGVVGAVALLWSASKAFAVALRAVDRAFVPTRRRSFVKEKLLAAVMALGIGGVIVVATVAAELLVLVERFAPQQFIVRWGLDKFLGIWPRLIDVSINTLAFALLFWMSPTRRVGLRAVLPEALAVAVALHLSRSLFVIYAVRMVDYGAIYGSLGSALAVLMWVLISTNVVLFGAELCAARYRFKARGQLR